MGGSSPWTSADDQQFPVQGGSGDGAGGGGDGRRTQWAGATATGGQHCAHADTCQRQEMKAKGGNGGKFAPRAAVRRGTRKDLMQVRGEA